MLKPPGPGGSPPCRRQLAEIWEAALASCGEEEALLLRALLATLPLSDLGDYGPELLLGCVRHGLRVRGEFPWCAALPEELFFRQVLYPRVNNEQLAPCRALFYEKLRPRVAGLPPGGSHFRGEPLVRRRGHLPLHRRPDGLGPGGIPVRLWPLRGGVHLRGQRPAGRGHRRPAGVCPLVVPLRRQPRLGGGLYRQPLAVFGGLRARAPAGPGLVHRGGGPGHAHPHPQLRSRPLGRGKAPVPRGRPPGYGPAGRRGVRERHPELRPGGPGHRHCPRPPGPAPVWGPGGPSTCSIWGSWPRSPPASPARTAPPGCGWARAACGSPPRRGSSGPRACSTPGSPRPWSSPWAGLLPRRPGSPSILPPRPPRPPTPRPCPRPKNRRAGPAWTMPPGCGRQSWPPPFPQSSAASQGRVAATLTEKDRASHIPPAVLEESLDALAWENSFPPRRVRARPALPPGGPGAPGPLAQGAGRCLPRGGAGPLPRRPRRPLGLGGRAHPGGGRHLPRPARHPPGHLPAESRRPRGPGGAVLRPVPQSGRARPVKLFRRRPPSTGRPTPSAPWGRGAPRRRCDPPGPGRPARRVPPELHPGPPHPPGLGDPCHRGRARGGRASALPGSGDLPVAHHPAVAGRGPAGPAAGLHPGPGGGENLPPLLPPGPGGGPAGPALPAAFHAL